jgi:hypothetical protein
VDMLVHTGVPATLWSSRAKSPLNDPIHALFSKLAMARIA